MKKQLIYSLLPLTLLTTPVFAEPIDNVDVALGGFIRGDLGIGDRYGDANSNDKLGISKAAFAVIPSYKNIKGVFVIGTEVTTDNHSGETGNVGIKDAFVTLDFGRYDFTIGAQPLLFGLKGAGYPGDHTIQGSVEFGAGGLFAVSNQAGPAAVLNVNINEDMAIKLGVFDQRDYENSGTVSASDATVTSGSKITDNVFVQLSHANLMQKNIQVIAGIERRYVGGTINASKNIAALGAAWKTKKIDLSAEYNVLDSAFNGTEGKEKYLIAETAFKPNASYRVYLDYSNASESDVTTIRLGANRYYNKFTMFTLEASRDKTASETMKSIDARVTFSF